jgi:hypothetical protein
VFGYLNKKNIMKILTTFILVAVLSCFSNKTSDNDLLYAKRLSNNKYAYFDKYGNKVLGDYYVVYTKTLKDYAIVSDPGTVLIDRKGRIIYDIFVVDNGPDYTRDGLYRIIKNGRIGYVDSLTSKLVIQPNYKCAYPFEKGKAKVSNSCNEIHEGEYYSWESTKWYYINKKGVIIK